MCVRRGSHLSRQAAEASHLALSEAVVWLAKPQRQPWRQRQAVLIYSVLIYSVSPLQVWEIYSQIVPLPRHAGSCRG